MAQPFDQHASCAPAGELDESLGEFWMRNPWEPTEHNLSAFERNRVLLNLHDGRFADISNSTGGADLDSDSRAVVAADFTGDGMPDLMIRSSGGGPLRLFENRMPHANSVRISLKGTDSNATGLGARLTAQINGRRVTREMQQQSCFRGQSPAVISIGMQNHPVIELLTIQWPSGLTSTFRDISANRHYRIIEGASEPRVVSVDSNAEQQ